MIYIKSFSLNTDRVHPFPFNIPAVRFSRNVILNTDITILVGDNGSGKSTLLESIGYKMNLPLIGGFMREDPSFEAARALEPYVTIDWQRQSRKGFFFRAEDLSNFIHAFEDERQKISQSLSELQGEVDDSIIRQMTENMNYRLFSMRKEYGDNMQAYSHGEAFLTILQSRIAGPGIYLLDEPEAALSPLKQLSLISFILQSVNRKNSQFIIATHSPIIMGLPGASIYQITEDNMEPVEYRETEHYSITKNFLENPGYFLRHL